MSVDEEGAPSSEYRTVKMSLNRFCAEDHRQQLVHRIDALVSTMNLAVAEGYTFANFHVTRCLEDPTFDVSKLPKLDRKFYYRCLIAVSTSKSHASTLGADLEASVRAYDALRPAGYVKADIRPYNQAVADMSIQMATMACNSVWANINRIIYRYLRAKHAPLKKHWPTIVKAVVAHPKTDLQKLFDFKDPLTRDAVSTAERLRTWLPLPTAKQFNTRAHLAMRLFHTVLQELTILTSEANSQAGRRWKPRLYNLLPRKESFTMSYMPISSMTLMKLISMGGKAALQAIEGDGRTEDADAIWRKFFNVNAVETRRARFDHRITTDGKTVSIQMQVGVSEDEQIVAGYPKDAEAAYCRLVAKEGLLVGVDPGMTDVATCSLSNGDTASFSSARFSDAAGYNTSARRTKRWNAETAELAASIPSSKVPTIDAMEAHIRGYLAVLPRLLKHRATRPYRKMRFTRYIGKQKTIEQVCDMIAPRDRAVVVGFGNWANSGEGISRTCSGPIREIRCRLSRRPNVLFKNIDEHKTSCTCHGCFRALVNMKADRMKWSRRESDGRWVTTKVERTKVHKVLHCRNSVCGTTWNRDVNASKNILLLLDTWMDGRERPAPFRRGTPVSPEAFVANYRVHVPSADASVGVECYPGGLPRQNTE
jgi:hypothetical protein